MKNTSNSRVLEERSSMMMNNGVKAGREKHPELKLNLKMVGKESKLFFRVLDCC